jgi:hypothetical protein
MHVIDLRLLVDLDGIVIEQIGGYWTKFEVSLSSSITREIPHGIRYSLTLHDPYGKRIMGFDNAHAVYLKKRIENTKRIKHTIISIVMQETRVCPMNL